MKPRSRRARTRARRGVRRLFTPPPLATFSAALAPAFYMRLVGWRLRADLGSFGELPSVRDEYQRAVALRLPDSR